jgi:HNH endonuclease
MADAVRHIPYRWAYEQFISPIPEGMTIDHLCRFPGCVNPWHLEPVPVAENVRRSQRDRAAERTVCRNGKHPWPESAMVLSLNEPKPRLYCTECRKERRSR